MSATEVNADRPANPVGVYIHKESGATLEATSAIQGDAFVRLGFVLRGEDEVAEEQPLHRQNRAELEATAEAEGVEITAELNTNKKLADAIRAQRGE